MVIFTRPALVRRGVATALGEDLRRRVCSRTIRDAAAATAANEWICVIGGWHPRNSSISAFPRATSSIVRWQAPGLRATLYEVAVLNSEGLRTSGVASYLTRDLTS